MFLRATQKLSILIYRMQNRESTEGSSNSIVWKNNDKNGERIGLIK